MATITDRKARSIKPTDKPIPSGVTGLWLHPGSQAGRGKWVLRYVSPVNGKRRDMGLGSFPSTGVARAVEKALSAREQIQDGLDPILIRDALREIPTFEQAAREQWEVLAPGFKNDKHRQQWLSSLEQHVFPKIGHIRVDRLAAEQFAQALNPIWLKIPETARRVKMRCSNVMAAARARKLIASNPIDDLAPLLPQTKKDPQTERHHPAMPWQTVPEFVSEHLSTEPVMGARAALLFAILTATRSAEVRLATWAEVDLQARLWTIPKERMKAEREHRVPLSDRAVMLLESLRAIHGGDDRPSDELLFPAIRGGQLSDMALTSLLRKAHAASDTTGRIATAHGFRSSFRNWCADHGVSTELAERALAHTIGNKVQAAYERTDRLNARVQLMQAWADHVTGRADERVIPLRHAT